MSNKLIWSINKEVLPQHADHAGVMWHGTYFNWLEEARIDALSKVGIDYHEITKKGYELPLVSANIIYKLPIYLGEKIKIETIFNIGSGPKINILSNFLNNEKKILTKAEIALVLINKKNFTIIRKRPDFISRAFQELKGNNI